MRWSIRYQWLLPFAGLLVIAVAVTSVTSAWLAARRNTEITIEQMNRVIATAEDSHFPLFANVLAQMRGLSGAEFATFGDDGALLATTLPADKVPVRELLALSEHGPIKNLPDAARVQIAGRGYFVSAIEQLDPSTRVASLIVLYPESRWQQARFDAIFPPLFVGGCTLGLMFLASAWLSGRMSRRIRRIQTQVGAIAAGEFQELPLDRRNDELQALSISVNEMSRQLQSMRETIRRTEQTRLLGQLAGGLAHQLRNAMTGARLAVQIHLRRCQTKDDDSLPVALRQLELTEEQIRGLLSVGKQEQRPAVRSLVKNILDDVALLVGPVAAHAGVAIKLESRYHDGRNEENTFAPDAEPIRSAVLNLVLNGIEAAGREGCVTVSGEFSDSALVFSVWDTGPGPPADLGDRIFDVLVTGKPEGTGFGLALARQVAEKYRGELRWSREDRRTCFRLTLRIPQ